MSPMSTGSNEPNPLLHHFHVCIDCGSSIRREELEGRGHTTGIFACPKCGAEGPLRLEIREVDQHSRDLHSDGQVKPSVEGSSDLFG
jgi:predicted RNA-binding Zn-ribbon protein involved in translation (DUF1610 family)